jgi:hypothetical protein
VTSLPAAAGRAQTFASPDLRAFFANEIPEELGHAQILADSQIPLAEFQRGPVSYLIALGLSGTIA